MSNEFSLCLKSGKGAYNSEDYLFADYNSTLFFYSGIKSRDIYLNYSNLLPFWLPISSP